MREVCIPEDALRDAYLAKGLSIAACAKLFNCSSGAIWNHLKKYDIETRTREAFTKFSKIPEEALRRAYCEEKKTLRECAEDFGVNLATLRKALRYYNIPVRKGGWIPGKSYPKLKRTGLELPGLDELWEQGYGVRDIAFLLSASEDTVRRRLKRRGLFEPHRKPRIRLDWGGRCPRCGILFDEESFKRTGNGLCQACEEEVTQSRITQIIREGKPSMDAFEQIIEGKTKTNGKIEYSSDELDNKELLSPRQVLERWRDTLLRYPPAVAGKHRKDWLSRINAQLTDGEKKLLNRLERKLAIKGLGAVLTLSLIAQIGILFLESESKRKVRWPEAIMRAPNKKSKRQ